MRLANLPLDWRSRCAGNTPAADTERNRTAGAENFRRLTLLIDELFFLNRHFIVFVLSTVPTFSYASTLKHESPIRLTTSRCNVTSMYFHLRFWMEMAYIWNESLIFGISRSFYYRKITSDLNNNENSEKKTSHRVTLVNSCFKHFIYTVLMNQ